MLLIKIAMGLLSLSFLILLHEFGHFIAARIFGVDVLTFSIGFGKKLLRWHWGKTEFALSLIPLGGYCKFKGEQNFIQAYEEKMERIPDEQGSIFSIHPWKRIIIAAAGPLMNLLTAWLFLLSIAWMDEVHFVLPSQIVLASEYAIDKDWPADDAGFQTGDKIISINGEPIKYYQEIEEVVLLSPGEVLDFQFERDGQIKSSQVIPGLDKNTGTGKMGIYPYIANKITRDFYVQKNDFIPKGSRIESIDGKPIELLTDIFPLIQQLDQTFQIIYQDPEGNTQSFLVSDKQLFLDNLPIPYERQVVKTAGLVKGVIKATGNFTSTVDLSLHSLSMLFKGIDLVNSLMGPIRAPLMTGEIAALSLSNKDIRGFQTILSFLASISVALGIINLLPIPVLDGGQILISFVDLIKKNPLSPDFLFRYQLIGSMIVFVLMFFSISIDILYFFRR